MKDWRDRMATETVGRVTNGVRMMQIVNGHCHRQLHWVCVYRQRTRWVSGRPSSPGTITATAKYAKTFPVFASKSGFCIDSERRFQCIHNFVEVIYIEMRWKLIFQRFFLCRLFGWKWKSIEPVRYLRLLPHSSIIYLYHVYVYIRFNVDSISIRNFLCSNRSERVRKVEKKSIQIAIN